jgi:serine/threonine protein kinase
MSSRQTKNTPKIRSFGFQPGRVFLQKYEVIRQIGQGWEGEVYLVKECETGIERAAKFFFPHRNLKNKTVHFYANKLHDLRHCPILIQYQTQEKMMHKKMPITFLISEFVEGEMLSVFLDRQTGKRLHPFVAVHLLHGLAAGLESVHSVKEYHGDLHTDNVLVNRFGLGFDLKLVDLYNWRDSKLENIREDVVKMIHIFYETLGGARYYSKQAACIKAICCGLKRTLILKKFKTAGQLKVYLENMIWE